MTRLDSIDRLHQQLFDMLRAIDTIFRDNGIDYFLGAGTALGAVRHGDFIPWDYDLDLLIPVPHYDRAYAVLQRHLPSPYVVTDPRYDAHYEHLFARVHMSSTHHKFVHADLFPLSGTSRVRSIQFVQLWFSRMLRKLFFLKRRARTGDMPRTKALLLLAGILNAAPDRLLVSAFWSIARMMPYGSARVRTNAAAGYMTRECMRREVFDAAERVVFRGIAFPAPSPVAEYLAALYGDYTRLPAEEQQRKELLVFPDWYEPALKDVRQELTCP